MARAGPALIHAGILAATFIFNRGFLADAIDLSAPFLFGAALLAGTAWHCRRQAGVMSDAITVGGRDS